MLRRFHMADTTSNTPVIPLPELGEGGPVDQNPGAGIPVIPLPELGEGGPVDQNPGAGIPVIPLPELGEGGPVDQNPGAVYPVIPLPELGEGGPVDQYPGISTATATVRFLHAAYGYGGLRIYVRSILAAQRLRYGTATSFLQIPAGYQIVTVTDSSGRIYLRQTLPFQQNARSTVAVIRTTAGLDLLQIPETCCPTAYGYGSFRVVNLAPNAGALDVLLADGRVVYADVYYKETTASRQIRPGTYQFYFARTDLSAMPADLDIETMDSSFLGAEPAILTVASLELTVKRRVQYTVCLLSSGAGSNSVEPLVLES